ncbi:MAG: glycosyltransferase [Candidatus Hydrogenedentes bacterium]|nr:glycosyltransferase [Candidatus Hydrogenedentota bacterium]
MKICILNVLHPPFDKRVFHKVATSLVRAGHTVVSIVPSTEPVPETQGITFHVIPPAASIRGRLISVVRLIRHGLRERADVYLGVEPESWFAGLVVKCLLGCKVVLDLHEYVPTEFAKFFPKSLHAAVAWITLAAMRIFARFTDHIILTRNSFDGQFAGLSTPRTVVINTNHVQPACGEIPEELSQRYGARPTLIHQGLFGDVRGSWKLLEAVRIVVRQKPDLKVIILGEYSYGSLDEYHLAIKNAGLDAVFDFESWVAYEKVPAYIAVSDIGLILFQPGPINHTLAMPHKLFDYMREAKPTIAPEFALEVRAIMAEADCGILVNVTDPQSIADAILRLLDDPAEARRLGENGRRAVETKFNWQNDERNLIAAFASLEKKK